MSLTGKLPVKIKCQLNGSPLSVDGKISFIPFGGEFDVDLKDLDVVAFSPYLKDALPGKLGGLKLSSHAAFTGMPEDFSLSGNLALADLDFVPDALPEAALEDARIDVNYNFRFNQKSGQLQLEKLMLDYNGIQVTSTGEVNELFNTPALELAVSVPTLDIRQALHAVPKALTGDMGTLDPAGSVTVDARLSGRAEEALGLLKDATIRLDSVQATAGGYRPALSGTLKLVGDELKSEKLFVRMGDNQADINLVASTLFAKTIRVKADVSSDHFDLDPLMKGGVGSAIATDQSPQNKTSRSSKEELGPFEIPLHATGTVKVAEAAWKGMTINDFIAEYQLKDNILEFARIDGQLAGGSFRNNARVDLGKKGLVYSAQVGLQSIQADPLLTALSPKAAGSLLGALNLDMNLSGRGTQWETLSKKLSGQGDMLISDGRVISPGLVKGFATFLQLPDTNEIAFSNFKGNIKVVDGKVKLDSSIKSDQIKLFPKGDIGLDGILKMSLDTRLSPQLSARLDAKGSVSKYLTDQDGWSQLPLLVSGSYTSPRFGLDPKGINEQAKKALSNELGRQLNKFLGDSGSASGQNPSESSDSKDPAPDPASQLLQKLFGN